MGTKIFFNHVDVVLPDIAGHYDELSFNIICITGRTSMYKAGKILPFKIIGRPYEKLCIKF